MCIRDRITYDGIRIDSLGEAYRDIFGYLPQEFGFYPEFTVRDYLEYMAALKGLKPGWSRRKIGELLETLTLEEVKNKKIVRLSGGMKRRVGIAQALLNEPEILILDEPTSGLDPGERVRFRNLLSEFAHDRIVLISTHIVPDVEYIAMKNAVMKLSLIHIYFPYRLSMVPSVSVWRKRRMAMRSCLHREVRRRMSGSGLTPWEAKMCIRDSVRPR